MRRHITQKDIDSVTTEDINKMNKIINNNIDVIHDIYCIGRTWFSTSDALTKTEIAHEMFTLFMMSFLGVYDLSNITHEQRIKSAVTYVVTTRKHSRLTERTLDNLFKGENDE